MKKVLLVTGGARGIGRAVVEMAASRGYDVAIGYRKNEEEAAQALGKVKSAGQRGLVVQADVAVEIDIVSMFEAVDRELGTITHLVNSAGMTHHSSAGELDGGEFHRLIMVNVAGTILCCREAVRRMSRRLGGQGGAIVNLSSMAAVGGGRPGAIHYAASKGAIDSYTIGLGKEAAQEGIRVNAVRPGVTLTDMTSAVRDNKSVYDAISSSIPMGRPGVTDEIAEAVLWLLSDAASFVTGTFIEAGGGGFAIKAPTQF